MNRPRGMIPAAVAALVVLGVSAFGLTSIINAMNLQLTKRPIEAPGGLQLHTLPESFPSPSPRWERLRADEIMSDEAMAELGTRNYISRWYKRVNADPDDPPIAVQVHCAYYTGMIDTVPHVPERCLVGGGMELAGETVLVDVPLDFSRLIRDPDQPDGEPPIWMGRSNETFGRVRLPRGVDDLKLRVTPFQDQSAKVRVFAGYFFIANGGVVASSNDVRLLAFKLSDDYAYYVKVQFLSTMVDSAEELGLIAADILNDLFPDLMRRLPDWIEVEAGRYPADNPRRAVPASGESATAKPSS